MSAPAFTQADVTKAITGAKAAGFTPTRVDIDRKTGKISLFMSNMSPDATSEDVALGEINGWLADNNKTEQQV